MRAIGFLIFFLILILGRPLSADDGSISWTWTGDSLSQDLESALRQKIPSISSAGDLSRLIQELASSVPLRSVEASMRDGKVVLDIKSSGVLVDVDLRVFGRKQKEVANKITDNYLGQVDSLFLRAKMQDELIQAFRNRGYFDVKLALETKNLFDEKGRKRVSYQVTIDYAQPCRISKISYSYDHPKSIKPETTLGDTCSMIDLKVVARQIEDDLVEDGYVGTVIETVRLRRNRVTNQGEVIFVGRLGKKVEVKILDKAQGLSFSDLFSSDEEGIFFSLDSSSEAISSEVLSRYRNLGYEEAKVKSVDVQDNPTIFKVTIQVDAGPRYRIGRFFFSGVSGPSEREVKSAMDLTSFIVMHPVFSEEKMVQAIANIKAFYREKGYWDVAVDEPEYIRNAKDGFIDVLIRVNEGQKHILSEMIISGVEDSVEEDLSEILELELGDAANPQALVDFEKGMRDYFYRRSFLHPKIEMVVKSKKNGQVNELRLEVLVKQDPAFASARFQWRALFLPTKIL